MLKKFSHTFIGRMLFSLILATIIFIIGISVKWRHENHHTYRLLKERKKPYIIVSWHEHIIGMTWNLPRPITTLNSPHSDGQILGKAVQLVGLNIVWGSSNKQALSGLRDLVKELKQGRNVGITPDGPRGPARKLAMGPVALAHLTGVEVIPVVFAADKQWCLNSWDKTRIPKPFSSAVILWGEPIKLANFAKKEFNKTSADSIIKKKKISKKIFEKWRQKIENELNVLTQKCDILISSNRNQPITKKR